MVQMNSQYSAEDGSNALSIILLSASMMSLVVTVIGIKLKWFRHRLTFKQQEDQTATPVLLKTTSVTEIRENCAGGVFRSFDEESLIVREKPVSNESSRPKSSSDRQSIFRLPFKSKLNLTGLSGREKAKADLIQPVQVYSRPTSSEKDVEMMYKNQYMKRMIHESLQSGNIVSMPDLRKKESLRRESYHERSVDEVVGVQKVDENMTKQENSRDNLKPDTGVHENITATREVLNEIVETLPEIKEVLPENDREIPREDIFERRVKFEEDSEVEEMEIERTQVLAYIENDYEDNSRSFDRNLSDVDEISIKLTNFDENSAKYQESFTNIEINSKESEDYSESSVEKLPPLRFISQTEGETMPPTPMKRKSRGSYFQQSSEDSQENFDEDYVEVELPPVIKPRTKRLVHRTSDVSKSEEFEPVGTETLQEIIKLSDETPEKLRREESSTSEVSEIFEVQRSESFPIPIVPKSILKTSDTSSSPKTITFKNLPQAISESDSSDSDEDIWSQVHQHRFIMQSSRHKDLPPPLPKTPPPSAEEEKQFSFA